MSKRKAMSLIAVLVFALIFISCSKTGKYKDSSGLFAFYNEASEKIGFIDKSGKVVINPQFDLSRDDLPTFSEGLARIRIDRKYGFIDTKGKIAINPQFENAMPFSEGMAAIAIDDKIGYINKKGKIIINPQFNGSFEESSFNEGLALISSGDKFGYVDKSGKIVINPQFEEASPFLEGLAVAGSRRNYGYIDKKGNYAINPQFREASQFHEGLALVRVGDNYGYIDKDGTFAINPQFSKASHFYEGLALVRSGDNYGYINKKGAFEINPQFESAKDFSCGLAAVASDDDAWGYIDKKGKYIINPIFDIAGDFINDRALVKLSSRKIGYIDTKGSYILDPRLPKISISSDSTNINSNSDFRIEAKGINQPVDILFMIENNGDKELLLNGDKPVMLQGNNISMFEITQQPDKKIEPEKSTVFSLRFTPKSEEEQSAVLSIPSNDSEHQNFLINVKAKVSNYEFQASTIRDMKTLGTAVESYMTDWGFAPQVNSIEELDASWFTPFYIKDVPQKDAWGNEFLYESYADLYSIASKGKDGVFDGFDQVGVYDSDEAFKDIIYSNGMFVLAPKIKKITNNPETTSGNSDSGLPRGAVHSMEEVMDEYLSAMDNFKNGIERAEDADEIAREMEKYSVRLRIIAPQFNALGKKYPQIKNMQVGNLPPELKKFETRMRGQMSAFLYLAGKIHEYRNDPKVMEANRKLQETINELQ